MLPKSNTYVRYNELHHWSEFEGKKKPVPVCLMHAYFC